MDIFLWGFSQAQKVYFCEFCVLQIFHDAFLSQKRPDMFFKSNNSQSPLIFFSAFYFCASLKKTHLNVSIKLFFQFKFFS